MQQGHHAVLITNQQEAGAFLNQIGVDPMGLDYMIPKAVFRCIKLKGISCKAANLLKQEMLSKGGEAAVARDTLNGEGVTDVLLMGTLKHYRLLTKKLRLQPFGLKELAGEIESILTYLEPHLTTIKLSNNKELKLGSRTMIMGICNVTPDSFSDGGRYFAADPAVRHALEMTEEGADIIDVGGASSRPGSIMAPADEEMRRIVPVIKRLRREGIVISVDTFRAEVARAALEAGADIINDIGGLQLDPELVNILSAYGAPAILMHNRMQLNAGKPYQDFIADIIAGLKQSLETAVKAGVDENRLIIDPGIGFVQTAAHDRLIIKHLADFKSLGKPILTGTSRKRFIGETLNLEVHDRLEGSLAAVVMAIMNGADIVRVHDVKASRRVAQMTDAVMRENG